MNTASFIENFAYLANAPTGTDKLRELVLSLAMQGALSEQRENDTPVSDLIESIEGEKKQLIESRAIRKTPKPLAIGAMEIRHPIPDEWLWVRFGTIAQHNAGKTLDRRRNTGTPRDYITTSNLYWGRFDLRELRQMLIRDEELERCTARKGDLLICEGGEAGRAAVWDSDKEVSFQNHVHRARFYGGIDPTFVFRFLQKLSYTGEINEYRKGVGISNMSGKALASIVLPLPPLEEQKRVVARVDELMALCDKLEAQQQERQKLFPALSRACNISFIYSPTPTSLKRIFDDPGAVLPAELRKSILTLAVHGKLIPQNPTDETAQSSLISCGVDLERWAVKINDQRENIPDSWIWIKFAGVGDQRLGKMLDTAKNRGKLKPYLRNTNVQWMRFELDDLKEMRVEKREEEELRLASGDLLICEGGEPGRCAIWREQTREMYFQKALHRVRPCEAVLPEFLALNLQIDCQNGVLAKYFTGATIKHLTGRALKAYPIPIPPLAEQLRIVERVDELMVLIDRLENQCHERDKLAEKFAKFTVASITGSTTKDYDPMKASRTELVTKLKTGTNPKAGSDAPLARLLAKQKDGVSAKLLWEKSGLEIDAFYHQLKSEMAKGWIVEPEKAVMKEVEAN